MISFRGGFVHPTAGFPLAEVVFTRSEDGEVTGFEASNGHTRDVWFQKQE